MYPYRLTKHSPLKTLSLTSFKHNRFYKRINKKYLLQLEKERKKSRKHYTTIATSHDQLQTIFNGESNLL